ncbi:unnamed protein product [Victoria cruziana]
MPLSQSQAAITLDQRRPSPARWVGLQRRLGVCSGTDRKIIVFVGGRVPRRAIYLRDVTMVVGEGLQEELRRRKQVFQLIKNSRS